MRHAAAASRSRKFCRLVALFTVGVGLTVAHASEAVTPDLSVERVTGVSVTGIPGDGWTVSDEWVFPSEPSHSTFPPPTPAVVPEPLPLLMIAIGIMLYRVRFAHVPKRDVNDTCPELKTVRAEARGSSLRG